jgi:mannose-6-phosphate isomerase class I
LDVPSAEIEVVSNGGFQVLTVTKGAIDAGVAVKQGHSVLLPAALEKVTVRALSAPAEIVRSYVPS